LLHSEKRSCETDKKAVEKLGRQSIGRVRQRFAPCQWYAHYINTILISSKWRNSIPLPESNQKLRLVSIGTAKPDAMELLSLDEDLIAMSLLHHHY
jgi:hypothetical protein